MSIKSIVGLGLVFGLLIIASSSIYFVDEREQALIIELGRPVEARQDPGPYLKKPFIQEVVRLDKRILSLDIKPIEVITKDQDRLIVDSFARYKISDPLLSYQATRYASDRNKRLASILVSSLRQVIAERTFQDVVSGDRRSAMQVIADRTNEEARKLGLEIIDVRLKRVDVPTENVQKIFARMETERKQEAAEERAKGQADATKTRAEADRESQQITAEAEKNALIIRGEADAFAVRVYADAFGKDKDFFEFYRTMQTYKKSLGKSDTTLVLSPDSDFFKLFMSGGKSKKEK